MSEQYQTGVTEKTPDGHFRSAFLTLELKADTYLEISQLGPKDLMSKEVMEKIIGESIVEIYDIHTKRRYFAPKDDGDLRRTWSRARYMKILEDSPEEWARVLKVLISNYETSVLN